MAGAGIYYATLELLSYQMLGPGHSPGYSEITLLAVFDELTNTVCIGAPSTNAAAFTFARMINGTGSNDPVVIACDQRRARIAYGMKKNFLRTAMRCSIFCVPSPTTISPIRWFTESSCSSPPQPHIPVRTFSKPLMHLVHAPFNMKNSVTKAAPSMAPSMW